MKILFIGDPHIKLSNLDISEKMFGLALKHAKEHNCDWICDLGDTFDNYALIQSQALRLYLNFYRKTIESNIKLIKLIGNHDYETQDCKNHAFECLRNKEGLLLVDKIKKIKNIVLMPFYRDNDKFTKEISNIDISNNNKYNYLICHQGFNNYDYGTGYIADKDVDLDDKKWGFTRIISGHFHKPADDIYVGTPFSHSFGESNQQKRFVVLDTDTNKFTEININELPRHITIKANIEDGKVIYEKPEFDIDYDKDKVRVIYVGVKNELDKIDYKEVKKEYKNVSIKKNIISNEDESIKIKEDSNHKDMVKEYFRIKGVEDKEVIGKAYKYLEECRGE